MAGLSTSQSVGGLALALCQNPAMTLVPELRELVEERVARLCAAQPALAARLADDDVFATRLRRLLLVSDYAGDRLLRDPGLLDALDRVIPPPSLSPDNEPQWAELLRRFRHARSVQLIWRDANDLDTIDDTLGATSHLADVCCETALRALEHLHAQRHGQALGADGAPQRMIVYGLGKHGGAELNFSSDIDLVFAWPEAGASDGAKPLDNEIYFQRLGQRLIQLLGEITADGFVYRVDMRLRPFGSTGRLALSFAAMEHYYQREGRDWERYAWIKARPVAGDVGAGEQLLQTLRPFVYRRYLDYGAFEGLREMKALIEAEVQRRDLAEHLKLGPGGIREIEFIVQLQQLIRAGREPELRVRGLLPALALLRERGHLAAASADALATAYRFLRRLENRLQMLREEQTHTLPADALTRTRIAAGLGYADWDHLAAAIERHRGIVSAEFARVFEARSRDRADGDALVAYWRQIDGDVASDALVDAGFDQAAALHARLHEFATSGAVRSLSARARGRLDRVLPTLLAAAARSAHPGEAAERALSLVHAVLRRSSYLALLDEQPSALARLVEVMAASAWMSERLCAHPVLLDDLLDARIDATPLNRADVATALTAALATIEADDTEARLLALNEFRQSQSFRIAVATVLRRQPALDGTRQLAWVAEAVVGAALPAVYDELARVHGQLPPGAGVAVLAYGSFGGEELGFGSDLDLVFLYDGRFAATESVASAETTAPLRVLDAARYHARAVQKLIALLATLTPAGRLYEIDPRLRPDGAKGLLVSTLQSFADYQRERSWTWEQQALVRARFIAGDAAVGAAFDAIRAETLARPRDAAQVRGDVVAMRQRMRAELDRSDDRRFDLKQGEGGLVDLEFLLQAGVLTQACAAPDLLHANRTPTLIAELAVAGWLQFDEADALLAAHAELLDRSLACTLDARPRLTEPDATLDHARNAIRAAWQRRLVD
jgi:[glutamine synthetase] adenylyltransferase / [glutamine synthetase]-adenylyl-L-tyrosine phosphorylase